ncbi:hypothetical protein N7478_004674 [Penicillium angulare]|uniref:uncharacterized protein n=1 Tax=Penicillium angulare TaxID=116970 RepID=UPI002541DCA4|nr:uncharacterized protein N7478_004674 [Penicillium angulare]KAJ5279302.1 hypothetical protein N7478_004674 [Penicillium angulare]
MSKYYEVIDTLIILAKGKKSSMLQTYHHAGIILCGWATVVYDSPCALVAGINVLVHTLMYTYFALQTLGYSVSTRVKRSLTTIQIAQFFIGMIFGTSFLFLSYKAPLDMSQMAVKNDSVLDFSPPASHGDTTRLVPKDTMIPCLSDSGEAATIYVSTIYIWPLIFLFVRFFIKSYSLKKR